MCEHHFELSRDEKLPSTKRRNILIAPSLLSYTMERRYMATDDPQKRDPMQMICFRGDPIALPMFGGTISSNTMSTPRTSPCPVHRIIMPKIDLLWSRRLKATIMTATRMITFRLYRARVLDQSVGRVQRPPSTNLGGSPRSPLLLLCYHL